MTVYFAKENFKTSVPLAITSLLVMYTLKASVTSKLPTTSYIKFIDIWLLYGLLIPFIILILLALIEHLPEESDVVVLQSSGTEKDIKRMSHHGSTIVKKIARQILPCFQIAFVLCYMCVAFNKYGSE